MGGRHRPPTSRLKSPNLLEWSSWRGDRVVDGTGLENRRGATHRGFESLPLRQIK